MNKKTKIDSQVLVTLCTVIHSSSSQTGSFIFNDYFEFQAFISNYCMSYIYLDSSLFSNLTCPKPNLPYKLVFLLSQLFLCTSKDSILFQAPNIHLLSTQAPSITFQLDSFCHTAGLSFLNQCFHHPALPGELLSKSQVQK